MIVRSVILSVIVSFCLSGPVSRITHECVNGRQPNMADMGRSRQLLVLMRIPMWTLGYFS